MRDYYATLQVDPRAEPEVIEAAYRRLARKHHPDASADPEAASRMRELNDAYEVLHDPARRRAYDAAWLASRPATPRRPSAVPLPLLAGIGALVAAFVALRLLPLIARHPPLLIGVAAAAVWLWWGARRSRRR